MERTFKNAAGATRRISYPAQTGDWKRKTVTIEYETGEARTTRHEDANYARLNAAQTINSWRATGWIETLLPAQETPQDTPQEQPQFASDEHAVEFWVARLSESRDRIDAWAQMTHSKLKPHVKTQVMAALTARHRLNTTTTQPQPAPPRPGKAPEPTLRQPPPANTAPPPSRPEGYRDIELE